MIDSGNLSNFFEAKPTAEIAVKGDAKLHAGPHQSEHDVASDVTVEVDGSRRRSCALIPRRAHEVPPPHAKA